MGFFYYLPGESPNRGASRLIDKYALEYAFKETPWLRAVANHTPDGRTGVILNDSGANPIIAAATEWLPMVCRDELPPAFLGWDTLPKPEELQKEKGLAEYNIELGDGQMWRMPFVRAVDLETGEPVCQLPFRWKVTSDGRWQPGDPVQQWRYLWEITEPAWQSMVAEADDSFELSHEQILEIALALFRVNYRIGPTEFNALGVFTRDYGPANLIAKCIGWDTWMVWREIKKKSNETTTATKSDSNQPEMNGFDMSDGKRGFTQDTPQHAPT